MAAPVPYAIARRQSSSDAFHTRHTRPATLEEGAFTPLDDLLRETFLSVRHANAQRTLANDLWATRALGRLRHLRTHRPRPVTPTLRLQVLEDTIGPEFRHKIDGVCSHLRSRLAAAC